MKALGANLCRCAGYWSIVEAVDRAAAVLRGQAVSVPPLPLGESWEEMAKATGTARYGADLVRDGMLHLKVVRSPHAHARVVDVIDLTTGRPPRACAGARARSGDLVTLYLVQSLV